MKHNTVVVDGKSVENLTAKQRKLLNLFLENLERTVNRGQILEKIWGGDSVNPKTVDVHLYNLRRKLHPYGYIIRSEGGGFWSLLSDRISDLSN
ncbi:MAG: hypothetical protein HN509_01735 [Halobacteriovoraceae bacterium]|jgi:DNA-binding response OmpR family regulator|nr:hypothetical protein [Halobacteriovoraceae bacterium]MBT5095672.1 hypothetical protein [Halobacteriovoraceae bacterium]